MYIYIYHAQASKFIASNISANIYTSNTVNATKNRKVLESRGITSGALRDLGTALRETTCTVMALNSYKWV